MKSFYIILLGQLVSVIGSGMTRFGLSVWVFEETGSATAFTTLIFFAVIPLAVGALFAGPLVDRLNRRMVMIFGNIIAGLSTLAVVLLFYSDVLAPWHLYITLSINGLANAFIIPALEASIPMLVSKEKLERASGLTQLVSALDAIVAPALAGALVTSIGLGVVFIADVVTFSLGVLSLLFVTIPQPDTDESEGLSFLEQLRFGITYLLERPSFVILIGFLSLFMFFQGVVYALTGPLVLSFASADGLGLTYTGFGVGALIGGLLLGVWGGPARRMDGIIGGIAVAGIGGILAGLQANILLIALGFMTFGAGFIFAIGLNRVIYQVKAAPEVLGRIFSLRVVIGVSMQSIGILIAGPLVTSVFEPLMAESGLLANSVGAVIGTGAGRGSALAYLAVGVISILFSLIALSPRIRKLEDSLPDYQTDKAEELLGT